MRRNAEEIFVRRQVEAIVEQYGAERDTANAGRVRAFQHRGEEFDVEIARRVAWMIEAERRGVDVEVTGAGWLMIRQRAVEPSRARRPDVHACGDPDCIVPHPPAGKKRPVSR
jgi:hypothetical protein